MPNGRTQTISEIEKLLAKVRQPRPPKIEPEVEEPILGLQDRLKAGQAVILTPELAKGMGMEVDLPENWMLKVTPPKNGEQPAFSYISPDRVEFQPEEIKIRGDKWLSSAELEEIRSGQFQAFDPETREFGAVTRAFVEASEAAGLTPQELREISSGQFLVKDLDTGEFVPTSEAGVARREEYYRVKARQDELTSLFKGVFPELLTPYTDEEAVDVTLAFVSQINESPEIQEQFFETVQTQGRTPETERLLQILLPGLTEEDLTGFFGTEVAIDVFGHKITLKRPDWWTLDFWLENFFKPYGGADLKGKAAASFISGIGDVISISGGTARWLGFEDVGKVLTEMGTPLQRMAPPDTSGEFEVSDLLDPEFYATKIVRTIPFALLLAPLAIGGYYGGAAVATAVGVGRIGSWIIGGLAGAALSRPAESAMEAGGAYDDAIARGKTEAEARKEADEVFKNNMVLAGADAWEIAIALAPTPKWVPTALVKGGLVRTARVGGKMVIVGLTEGGEEMYQDMITRRARGEEWQLDPVAKEVFAIGMVMGMGMGLGGDVISSIVSKSKGDMSPSLKKDFASAVTDFKGEGFTDEQAELRALDTIAEIPEGEQIIQEVIKEAKVEEEVVPEVAPVVPETVTPEVTAPIEPIPPEVVPVTEPTPTAPEVVPEAERVGLRIEEMGAEVAGLKEWLKTEPATKLVDIINKTGWHKGEIKDLTLKQYRDITGKREILPNILTKDKKHVRWEYALDEVATELGYESDEALKTEIERVGKSLARIRELEAEIRVTEVPEIPPMAPVAEVVVPAVVEVVPEVDVEVRRQLSELTKMHDYWRDKLVTSEQTKVSLAKFVRENLPVNVRGKYVTAIARVKTDEQLQFQIAKVSEFAELNAQKVLKVEVRKELKKTQAVVKDKILKGKFTPETQVYLDTINHNLDTDRDTAREKMAGNISKYDSGELSYEDMLKENEALNFAGIDGMSSEELMETLEYIKVLKLLGRSERQAKQETATEKIRATRTDIGSILTGGKGLKEGIGAVPREQLAAKPGWVDTFVNWQYSLDNLADKLSKLDPTSKPYQSEINKFVALAHRATSRQAVATRDAYNKVKGIVQEVYKVKSNHDVNQVLNGLGEEVNLGTFEFTEEYKANNPGVTTVNIRMTRDEMIAKYMQMQDLTLDNTFTTGMGWSQEVRDVVENTLTAEEKKLAEAYFQFYEEGYPSVNKIYTELYNVDMPHNPNYSPIRRDLEGDIAENVLTFQDAQQYAAVTAQSIKARIRNIRPLRFNGATQLLSNHIDQMEHFKAWATTMRDFRRVFGNTEIRQAIEQYHGRGISKLLDTFMAQMARDGVETAATNRTADLLRRNFTKSILAIKPVVGLKQIPSLFAYISEMNVTEFFGGVADYWTAPIKNFKFLYANSEGYRARVSQGFERDIRAATAKHGVNKISGRGGFVDWFLLQIRLADTFAVTQGMWAKYKVGLKEGLSQQEAIAAAEDTTNRTQPSFGIDTLSAIQNGGSWFKLMTMFQNQPNKYFRIVGDNLRNFKYGRGSRVKAAETIILAWVVLPMMFQFIADAFQWKPERQLRAGLLGPLNFILIGGQLVQSVWGWLTDLPFDYQISPVAQTLRDLQTIVNKTKKLVAQGKDPYKDISVDDVASLLEYLAKATGQVTGLPTPYFVQVSRGIREKLAEDKDIDIKDFLFSQWALQPPAKDAEEKVEDANLKLGEIKEGQEDLPLTEKELKIFTTVDWFREIGDAYSNVLPQDVLIDKNVSKESKAWAQYEIARSKADILPNISLHKINTEDNADTIVELYKIWKARDGITSLAKLKEYDKLYRNAGVPITHGNVTRQQYSLLVKYLEAEDKDTFLEAHPELKTTPRNEWLIANPVDNAILAIGGQAKILGLEAYNEFNKLIKELDIPDDAIPEQTLPPKESAENYFKYNETVEEFSANSWEVQLIIAQDDGLREFLGREPIDTPVRSLELKIKHRPLFEQYDALETDEDRAKLKSDNPGWVDDMRRIEAIENVASDATIEAWVGRGKVVDEFTAGSSEAKVWLLDNPETFKWALDQGLLTDDGSDWNENVLRLNVEMAKLDEESEEFKQLEIKKRAYQTVPEHVDQYVEYYNLPETGYRRKRYLADNPEFTKATGLKMPENVPVVQYDEIHEKYQADFEKLAGLSDKKSEHYIKDPEQREFAREAMRFKNGKLTEFGAAEIRKKGYGFFVPEKYIDRFVDYESVRSEGKPPDYPEGIRYYEDEWYLFDHPLFYKDIYRAQLGLGEVNFDNVPTPDQRRVYTRRVFDLYETFKGLPVGKARREFETANPDLDLLLHLEFGTMLESERAKVEPKKEVKEPVKEKEGETARERTLREIAELEERLKR